ncbi:MAG: hypothetical protein HYV02_06115 [Deltaproteobacteria bacterium]|nr:hypothetical protein [Deltaproteobacteria bacterium]
MKYGCVMLGVLCAGCGGSPAGMVDVAGTGVPALAIVLHQEKAVSPHPLSLVTAYDITVEGPDFAPITMTIDGTASTGTVEEIPAGSARRVEVVARNTRGDIIRRATVEGVTIAKGRVETLDVTLATVPIFANLTEGVVITNTRLQPEVLMTPGEAVQCSYVVEGGLPLPLFDLAAESDTLVTDATGVATLHTAPLPPGTYRLQVASVNGAEGEPVTIHLLDGRLRTSAPLWSAAVVSVRGRWVVGGAARSQR